MNIKLENLGTVNKNLVTIITEKRNLYIYFSYETAVAFRTNGVTVCRVNEWGPTTAKLLNEVCPFKDERISGDEFEKQLADMLNSL